MIPEEKAKELILKFSSEWIQRPAGIVTKLSSNPEVCALICVEEILKELKRTWNEGYWQLVKNSLMSVKIEG